MAQWTGCGWTCYNPATNTLTENVPNPFDNESGNLADCKWDGCRFYCWADDLTFYNPFEPGRVGYTLPLITTRDGIIRLNRVLVLRQHDDCDYDDEE